MAGQTLKKGKLFFTLVVLVGSLVTVDSVRRNFFTENISNIVEVGSFKNSGADIQNNVVANEVLGSTSQSLQGNTEFSTLGYSQLSIQSSQLSEGYLAVYDTQSQAPVASGNMVKLCDVKNDCYSISDDSLLLNKEAADALNQMMSDYNINTGFSDFVIYNTTQYTDDSDSVCDTYFAESASGNTIDLAIQWDGLLYEYDGLDLEAWVAENCANYGYVVRYPSSKQNITGQPGCIWHLRYVGGVHSAIMKEHDFCLEEYVEWLKSYTTSSPLNYTYNLAQYEIYYTPMFGEMTQVNIPISGNYNISGNNFDGYIVTALKQMVS